MTTTPGPVPPGRVAALTARVVLTADPVLRETISPLTGTPIATVAQSSLEAVERAFAAARRAQVGWAATSVRDRAAVAMRLHDLVLDEQVEIIDLIQLESGKARSHAFEEVADVALCARYYGRLAPTALRDEQVPGLFPVLTRTRIVHHPVGVVGVVAPWNYPFSLAITDLLAALMAGNSVVLRPDPQTALTALIGVELLHRAGLPEGVLQVVVGDGATIGNAVVESADYVCFTGSTATGRRVAEIAGRRLVGVSTELGGKNSAYVRADADLARAVPGVLRSAFASAGQLCMHSERIVLHRDIAADFIPAAIEAVRGMRIGVDLEYGIDMGSLLNATQLARTREHLADAVAHGAQVLVGGHERPEIGPFVHEPTLLTGVTPAMRCYAQETFGPLASIIVVDDDDQAIEVVNDTEYGLNASVWSRDTAAAQRIARLLRCGTVNVNEGYAAAWGSMAAPMGGMKASGVGRRHGVGGLLKYTQSQNVTTQLAIGVSGPPDLAALTGVPALARVHLTDERWARVLDLGIRGMRLIGRR